MAAREGACDWPPGGAVARRRNVIVMHMKLFIDRPRNRPLDSRRRRSCRRVSNRYVFISLVQLTDGG